MIAPPVLVTVISAVIVGENRFSKYLTATARPFKSTDLLPSAEYNVISSYIDASIAAIYPILARYLFLLSLLFNPPEIRIVFPPPDS